MIFQMFKFQPVNNKTFKGLHIKSKLQIFPDYELNGVEYYSYNNLSL